MIYYEILLLLMQRQWILPVHLIVVEPLLLILAKKLEMRSLSSASISAVVIVDNISPLKIRLTPGTVTPTRWSVTRSYKHNIGLGVNIDERRWWGRQEDRLPVGSCTFGPCPSDRQYHWQHCVIHFVDALLVFSRSHTAYNADNVHIRHRSRNLLKTREPTYLARRYFIARARFWICDRSSCIETTIPVGK